MRFELPPRSSRILAKAKDEEQEIVLDATTASDMLSWDADFEEWANKAQLPRSPLRSRFPRGTLRR